MNTYTIEQINRSKKNPIYEYRGFKIYSEYLVGEGKKWLATPILPEKIHIVIENFNIDRYDTPRYVDIICYNSENDYKNRDKNTPWYEIKGAKLNHTIGENIDDVTNIIDDYLDSNKCEMQYMGISLDKYFKN